MQANGPAITGPGGVKVYYRPGGSYMYSNDPYMQQSYQMAGMGMRQPVDIGTYVPTGSWRLPWKRWACAS
jgi:hypothetical protein